MRLLSAWIHASDLNVSDLVIETWHTVSRSLCLSCLHRETDEQLFLICSPKFLFTVEA